jgi:hypothetical protein
MLSLLGCAHDHFFSAFWDINQINLPDKNHFTLGNI